jgi:hypothetical protein
MNKDVRWTTPKLLGFICVEGGQTASSTTFLGVPTKGAKPWLCRNIKMKEIDEMIRIKGGGEGPDRRQDVQELGTDDLPVVQYLINCLQ